MTFAFNVSADENIAALCEPPAGDESPFAGTDYTRDSVAQRCVSAYPRVDNIHEQANYQLAVAKRCKSIYAMHTNSGSHEETYQQACISAEENFRKSSAGWVGNKVIDRVEKPVCSATSTDGPDGERLHVCVVYFSTENYSEPARALRDDAIILEN